MLLKRLGIEMPSLEFVEKSREVWESRKTASGSSSSPELAAGEVELTYINKLAEADIHWNWKDFIYHFSDGSRNDTGSQVHRKVVDRSTGEVTEEANWPLPTLESEKEKECLVAVDLSNRIGKSEP